LPSHLSLPFDHNGDYLLRCDGANRNRECDAQGSHSDDRGGPTRLLMLRFRQQVPRADRDK